MMFKAGLHYENKKDKHTVYCGKMSLLSILFILFTFLFFTMQTLKDIDKLSASSSLYDILVIKVFAFALFEAIIYYGQEMLMFHPTNSKESNTYKRERRLATSLKT